MRQTLKNIFFLGIKELRGLWRDYMLIALIVYAFSLGIYMTGKSTNDTINNAAIAIVDEDRSQMSQRIFDAFFPPMFHRAEEITLEGKKIFYTHGNNYAVDFGLGNIISAARSRESDIVLFGHTHKPLEKYIPEDEEGGALYLVNPGSIGGVRAPESTYAIITIEGDNVLISHGKL